MCGAVVLGYVLTFTGLTSWSFLAPLGNPLTWTISTMFFFYLMFPALAPRLQRLSPSSLPLLNWCMYILQFCLMAIGFSTLPEEWAYWVRMQPLVRLPVFVMGICCGLMRVHLEQEVQADLEGETPVSARERPRPVEDACCCCALEPVLGPVALMGLWFVMTLASSLSAFFCSELFGVVRFYLEVALPILFFYWVLALTSPVNQRSFVVLFFKSRVMRFLGDISMGAYMIHLLLLIPLAYWSDTELNRGPTPLVLATVLPATILLGWFCTACFEKPIARCLRPDKKARRQELKETVPAVVMGSPVKVNM